MHAELLPEARALLNVAPQKKLSCHHTPPLCKKLLAVTENLPTFPKTKDGTMQIKVLMHLQSQFEHIWDGGEILLKCFYLHDGIKTCGAEAALLAKRPEYDHAISVVRGHMRVEEPDGLTRGGIHAKKKDTMIISFSLLYDISFTKHLSHHVSFSPSQLSFAFLADSLFWQENVCIM